MSARVMNPAVTMMAEMSSKLSRDIMVVSGGGGGAGGASAKPEVAASVGRTGPSRAELARVRRDLFGPVDHKDARAYAERELRAQSLLDTERWGFDFKLEVPKSDPNSRFEWMPVTKDDVVPAPYALRGMPYLRKQTPRTPAKSPLKSPLKSPAKSSPSSSQESSPATATASIRLEIASPTLTPSAQQTKMQLSERTPPQEARVPIIGEKTPDVVPAIRELSVRSTPSPRASSPLAQQTTTPVLSARKQAAITDFMKSRKRTLNGSSKSLVEPPEKVTRNAGQIRS